MPYITTEQPKPVPPSRLLLKDRTPDAVDWIILPGVEIAVSQDDLIQPETKQPVASLVSSTKLITEYAVSTSQPFQEFRGQSYHAHSQWGLNE